MSTEAAYFFYYWSLPPHIRIQTPAPGTEAARLFQQHNHHLENPQ